MKALVYEAEKERVTEFKPGGAAVHGARAEPARKPQEQPAISPQGDLVLQREIPDRRVAEATLRAIVEGVEAEIGVRFFSSLVQHLAYALGVQYAFVSEVSEDRTHFRTLAESAVLTRRVTPTCSDAPSHRIYSKRE